MQLTGIERHTWVSDKLHLIDTGRVKLVVWQLKGYQGQGRKRITNLSEYLERFADAVHYEKFRSPCVYPLVRGKWKALIGIFRKSG